MAEPTTQSRLLEIGAAISDFEEATKDAERIVTKDGTTAYAKSRREQAGKLKARVWRLVSELASSLSAAPAPAVLDEREAFEQWARDKHPKRDLFRRNDGKYQDRTTRVMWAAWHAARSTLSHGDAGRTREAAEKIVDALNVAAIIHPTDKWRDKIAALLLPYVSPVPGLTEADINILSLATKHIDGCWNPDAAARFREIITRLTSPRADRRKTMDREEYLLPAANAADQFARELSDLGRKHGIGISGPVQLFMLEHEDRAHNYTVSDESMMELT